MIGQSPSLATANLLPPSRQLPVLQLSLWEAPRQERNNLFAKTATMPALATQTAIPKATALTERDDFELIDLTLAGQHDAFDTLIRRYKSPIYALAYRILHNYDDAADIAQETFLKAYEALATFQKKSSFHTWLYRIATNSCINYLRRHGAQYHIELAAYHAVKDAESLDNLYKIELQDVVNEAIEKLPEKQKATVMLSVCEGLSHREVSCILKCSVGTAKANYFHAIRNLRRFMKNYIAANEDLISPTLLRTAGLAH